MNKRAHLETEWAAGVFEVQTPSMKKNGDALVGKGLESTRIGLQSLEHRVQSLSYPLSFLMSLFFEFGWQFPGTAPVISLAVFLLR